MTDLQKALATLEHSGHTQSQTFCCIGLILTNFILDKSSLCLSLYVYVFENQAERAHLW